ncbi:MAG: hypothetical protein HOY79_31810 [Streptomyces sp.]|nr:hypothetical protein [Streptomyces sp.]
MSRILRTATSTAATLLAAIAALTGCGGSSAPSGPAPQESPTFVQTSQQRSYACGSRVAPPARDSAAVDPVRLAITVVRLRGKSVTAAFAITSGNPEEILSLPIEPTPPTVLLLHAGRIVGHQRKHATGTLDGLVAHPQPLRHPYTSSLTVNQLCPGITWADVHTAPAQYTLEIVMSRQPTSGPQTAPPPSHHADPLTTAFLPLPR